MNKIFKLRNYVEWKMIFNQLVFKEYFTQKLKFAKKCTHPQAI